MPTNNDVHPKQINNLQQLCDAFSLTITLGRKRIAVHAARSHTRAAARDEFMIVIIINRPFAAAAADYLSLDPHGERVCCTRQEMHSALLRSGWECAPHFIVIGESLAPPPPCDISG